MICQPHAVLRAEESISFLPHSMCVNGINDRLSMPFADGDGGIVIVSQMHVLPALLQQSFWLMLSTYFSPVPCQRTAGGSRGSNSRSTGIEWP